MSIIIRKPQRIPKVWGCEEIIANDAIDGYCGKIMILEAGFQSSLHFHLVKVETMHVLRGSMTVESPKDTFHTVRPGDVIHIPAKTPHRFIASDEVCVFVEFSTWHSDADVERLEESRRIS